MSKKKITVALLDMYNGEPNQGMRCIIDIINRFNPIVSFKIFDVRGKCELPEIGQYDIYISSGGPGNPLIGDGSWDVKYFEFIDALTKWNNENEIKKHVLFICHSFQMACKHFGLAEITKRNDTSFGVMTIHKTKEGLEDSLFEGLSAPSCNPLKFETLSTPNKNSMRVYSAVGTLEMVTMFSSGLIK